MLRKCVTLNTNYTAQTENYHIILYKDSYSFSEFEVLNKEINRRFYLM